jgi:hypothetical protein
MKDLGTLTGLYLVNYVLKSGSGHQWMVICPGEMIAFGRAFSVALGICHSD